VLYIAAITIAAWIVTSGPRLSYFGVQLAVAFCLINLLEFKFQTSLTVARDRVVGVLLGLFMMWLFFDHLWSTPAGLEMKTTFISALRLVGRLARGPVSNDLRQAIEDSYLLREEINAKFDRVRSLADDVLFEFGPSRSTDLELRARIRRWQPQLRALFVMRIALLKYRLQAPGFELPDAVRVRQEAYDDVSARTLEEMADRMENQIPGIGSGDEQRDELMRRLHEAEAEASGALPRPRAQSFLTLLHGINALTNSLAAEIASEAPRSVLRS
jgi:multidrug resistance protein MdtO